MQQYQYIKWPAGQQHGVVTRHVILSPLGDPIDWPLYMGDNTGYIYIEVSGSSFHIQCTLICQLSKFTIVKIFVFSHFSIKFYCNHFSSDINKYYQNTQKQDPTRVAM